MPGSEPTPALLNEKTAFTWPVVASLITCAVLVGGGMMQVEGLRRDHDLLRARVDLLEHQQSADRGQLHAQGATLVQVKEILLELKGDVRDALRGGVRSASHQQ